jgi:hypothetical protein
LFTNFKQDRYVISPYFTLACDYLLEWIPKLNQSYEQQKSPLVKGFNASSNTKINSLLPLLSEFRTVDWKKVQQELEFSGLLSLPLFAGLK